MFRSLNRNKRSIALDLRGEAGKAVVYDLVKTADVVVNNFRAGVMDRMGFGYEALSKINPRIICAFGSGFGQSGPLSHKGGQDILAQALSGVMARKPDQSLPTSVYATALADYSAGMHLVQGILLALMQREKTGVGQALSVSLYDSMLAMQMQEAAMWLQRKREPELGRLPLTGVFADHRRRAGDRRRLQGQSAAGHLPRARLARPVGRSELRHLRQAGGEQGGTAPPVPQQALDRHDGTLARQARGAGSPVRAGADPGRSTGVGADRARTT